MIRGVVLGLLAFLLVAFFLWGTAAAFIAYGFWGLLIAVVCVIVITYWCVSKVDSNL